MKTSLVDKKIHTTLDKNMDPTVDVSAIPTRAEAAVDAMDERDIALIFESRGPHATRVGAIPRRGGPRDHSIRLHAFLRPFRTHFNQDVRDVHSTTPDVWTSDYIHQLVSHVDYRNYARWKGEDRGYGNRTRTWRRFVELNLAGTFGYRRVRAIENIIRRIQNTMEDRSIPKLTLPGGDRFDDVITGEEIKDNDVVLISISTGAPSYRTTIEGITPADLRFEFGSMIKLNAESISADGVAESVTRSYENLNHDTILRQLPVALVIARVKYPLATAFGSRRIVHFGQFVHEYCKKHDCSADYALAKYMKAMSLL